ncbi:hypothetical protein EHS17_14345 [Rhodobacteraceae bacterium CH30]|nr:hypothetical protein EHS17_14345 [Rhodobacteraceae bacterium CH30]
MDMTLIGNGEPLCDELAMHVTGDGKFSSLRHPLVSITPYHESMNAIFNRMLEHKRESIQQSIKAEDWENFVFLHERPYRLNAIVELRNNMNVEFKALASIVLSAYSDSENISENSELWRELLTTAAQYTKEMNDSDISGMSEISALWGKTVTLYHGGEVPIEGARWCWTLDLEKARWFADRFEREGALYACEVAGEYIDFILHHRGESEVLVMKDSAIKNMREI